MRATIPSLALPGNSPWRDSAARGRGGTRWPARLAIWRARRPWLAATAVLIAVAGFCTLVQGPQWRSFLPLATVNLVVSLLFVFTGLMLGREPGQRVTAWALMLAGVFRSIDFIDAWHGPWSAYTLVFGGVDRIFGAWALLRYPNSALSPLYRRYLITFAVWMLTGRTLIAVTSTAQWNAAWSASWWPTLIPDQQLSNLLNYVVHGGEGVGGLALMALLIIRLKQTRGLDRIVITPIIVAGIAAVVAAIASATMMTLSLADTPNEAYLTESVVDFAIPVAFLIAVLQRLLLIRNVTELTAQVTAGGDLDAVRRALRSVLHDPTLDLLDTSDASLQALGSHSSGRLVSYIRAGHGTPIAVVIADPALARYRELFDAATAASGLALQNAQLQARMAQEKLEQVKASRARIVEAELAERRRLERDLHDGVQQHLLGITAGLTAAKARTADPEAAAAIGQAGEGLKAVLAQLRDLAHGIHPAILSQGGLGAALEEVAERLPLPVSVQAPPRRFDAAVEATLYFVACEALANIVKHANAESASVTVRDGESVLEMEVADDGIGGLAADAGNGLASHGLANMADRVGALDGEIVIDSPPGWGTRLVVRVPCA
ncbi:MAG TPA: histidine kinase [Trebonia sp.]|jgi:signal transduction histidine kinase